MINLKKEGLDITKKVKKRREIRGKLRADHGGVIKTWTEMRPLSNQEYRLSSDINGLRQTLRHRRSQSFTEGLYTSTRKYVYARKPEGQFGIHDYERVNKGDVLLYSHIDELGRVYFICSDARVVAVKGCEVDGIARIAKAED
mgnify:CR=1 FL=1